MNLLFLSSLAFIVNGHTFLLTPVARDLSWHSNLDLKQECGGDLNVTRTYTRGQSVPFGWGRNNHHGGFTQMSILSLADSQRPDAAALFDDPSNIFFTSCYNRLCQAQATGDRFGFGADGTDFQKTVCATQVPMPSYLPDGDYTLKFITFGSGSDEGGIRNAPLGSFSNCHNFKINGGALTTKPANNAHIKFDLEDRGLQIINDKNPTFNIDRTGQCLFIGTNSHLGCRQLTADGPPTCTGEIADVSKCGSGSLADSISSCVAESNDTITDGNIFNYLIGKPYYHPEYDGKFKLLSYVRDPVVIQLATQVKDNDTLSTADDSSLSPIVVIAASAGGILVLLAVITYKLSSNRNNNSGSSVGSLGYFYNVEPSYGYDNNSNNNTMSMGHYSPGMPPSPMRSNPPTLPRRPQAPPGFDENDDLENRSSFTPYKISGAALPQQYR